MTRTEARKIARQLHKGGVENVRIVEHLEDGDITLLVQSNNVGLETVADVTDFVRRNLGWHW